MNVVVSGLMTNYQKTGSGKTLVFLPGWGDDSRSFAGLTNSLKDKYEIITLDLPGFGGTQIPPHAWNLDDYAGFVEHFLKKIKAEPAALVGHSYGGAVAVVLAARGLKLKKLILLASAGIRNKNPARKKILAGGAKLGKLPLIFLPSQKQKQVKARFYKSIGSDFMALPHMQQTFKEIINQDVRQSAEQINVPTLLIYGSRDKATPVRDGHILNRSIKGSRLEVVGAGHFLHQEEPDKLAGLIDNFLKT